MVNMVLPLPYVAVKERNSTKEYGLDKLRSDGITLLYTEDKGETPLDPSSVLQLISVFDSPRRVRVLRELTAGQMAVSGRYNSFVRHFHDADKYRRLKAEKFSALGDVFRPKPESLEDMAKRLASEHFPLKDNEEAQTSLSVYQ
jgi:hypothetical protein